MALTISVFSLLFVIGLFTLVITITHEQLKQQKIQSIAEEVHGYNLVISRQVEEFNYVSVDDLTQMSLRSPNLIAIQVFNEYKQEISRAPSEFPNNSDKVFTQDLRSSRDNQVKIGEIKIWWTINENLINTNSLYLQLVIFAPLFMISLSLLIYHILAVSIVRPLSNLEKSLREFKPGQSFSRSRYLSREIHSLQDQYTELAERVYKQMHYLKKLASIDSLTNLSNRSTIEKNIQALIDKNKDSQKPFAVLFIDIDHFKTINDVYGHETGDEVIKGFSKILLSLLNDRSLLGRFGGDEFILLIPSANYINLVLNKIYKNLERDFTFSGRRIYISISTGVALWPHDGETKEIILKNADLALYQSKRNGRNQANFYSSSMAQVANQCLINIDTLRTAMRDNRFIFYWQPVVNKNNKIVWHELLIRLIQEDKNIILPSIFLKSAEEHGLMKNIVEFTCNFTYDLLKNKKIERPIAINLSRSQLVLPEIKKYFSKLKPWRHQIIIEVTEDSFLGDKKTVSTLIDFKKNGFTIALDDFGTGFSSLAMLINLPIDIVKLDKEFQKNIQRSNDKKAMLKAIIFMLKILGKKVVAEGIENKSQYSFALASGSDYLQGYYIAKPQKIDT